jgi:hypothetical protein
MLAPTRLAERLGVDPQENPAMLYALRMFGIRTVLIAGDLLVGDKRTRERALRTAPLIHATDMVAAALVAASGKAPRRTGALITGISAAHTVLALVASRRAAAS